MAILAPFRAPQPKGWYTFPGTVANDGGSRGWVASRNSGNFANLAILNQFAAGAFQWPVADRVLPGNRFVIPARFGRSRGVLAYRIPPAP